MPIYAYKCDACGHAKDVLQKISDPLLSVCPACGAAAFTKQLTAAGFQLKGSGWYVTDFRNGSGAAAKPADGVKTGDAAETGATTGTAAVEGASPASDSPAPASAPAASPAVAAPTSTASGGASKPASKPL